MLRSSVPVLAVGGEACVHCAVVDLAPALWLCSNCGAVHSSAGNHTSVLPTPPCTVLLPRQRDRELLPFIVPHVFDSFWWVSVFWVLWLPQVRLRCIAYSSRSKLLSASLKHEAPQSLPIHLRPHPSRSYAVLSLIWVTTIGEIHFCLLVRHPPLFHFPRFAAHYGVGAAKEHCGGEDVASPASHPKAAGIG